MLRKLFRSTPTLEEVLNVPTAFFGHTVETCFKDGSWPKIGKWPNIRKDQFRDPPTYTEDILSPGRFNILGGRDMVRGTVRDTIGLDPFVMDVDPEDFIKRIEKKVEFGIIEP
ncbi:MAG: hypothetical protein NT138_15195 [Planctomycetales bacterium]|nr:hypothetical protein [Planctomycetales bacterium]